MIKSPDLPLSLWSEVPRLLTWAAVARSQDASDVGSMLTEFLVLLWGSSLTVD